MKRWREEPFVMISGGQRWLPPPLSSSFKKPQGLGGGGGSAGAGGMGREGEGGRGGHDRPLSDLERDKFEDILR